MHLAFRIPSLSHNKECDSRTGGRLLSEGLGLPHPFYGPVFSVAQSSGEAFSLGAVVGTGGGAPSLRLRAASPCPAWEV